MKMFKALAVLLLLSSTAAYADPAPAADAANAAPGTPGGPPAPPSPVMAPAVDEMTAEEMNKPFHESFFLTPLEVAAINQALQGRVTKSQTLNTQTQASVPEHRIIRIAGVLYRSPSDWVVWMNNQKVTPDNLLPEIVDIKVKPSSKVSLQWYDVGLNQVLSITLRPHETYDITTGILLPK